MVEPIREFQGEYRFLSNFYVCPVQYKGRTWLSSEHAYQAAKSTERAEQDAIQRSPSPGIAKKLGKRVSLRPDWERVKLMVMEEIVCAKFSGNQRLRNLLVLTGDRELIEGNYWHDTFWGVCNGRGANHLGRILMKVREKLQEPRKTYGSRHVADSGPDYRE